MEGSWAWLGPPWEISVREWRHLNIETDKSAKMATRDQCLFYHLSLFPLTNTRYYCLNNWMIFFQMLSKIPDWFIMCRWKVQKNANHNNFCNLFLKCLLMDMRHPYHISIFAPTTRQNCSGERYLQNLMRLLWESDNILLVTMGPNLMHATDVFKKTFCKLNLIALAHSQWSRTVKFCGVHTLE